jgi:hypothetical protein
VPLEVLERAVRWEVALAAVPTSVLALVGAGAVGAVTVFGDPVVLLVDLALRAATLGLIWLALLASTRLVRPWLRRAVDPANLRTT